ncbi:CBS domain-containing protein CBSX1, chloroplastic-like [Phalaenopsis equestris]|uniref:CBS domain-containing protein CBSX1, chloroplastic-like n=1 Tax=Phalaenopsis equestris TaxID=78828 RepID=UPI0009E46FF5|nr:CBS domain-containing protein CBSX1, chloroplastic-like [Phalaenopsis equestris]XP_020584099.1 CBS domain-containing protein CBSX1, chloroplastic-like [Phalaenopsis equestris]
MGSLPSDSLVLHQLCPAAAVLRSATVPAFFGGSFVPFSGPSIRRRSICLFPAADGRVSASARNGSLVSNSMKSNNGIYTIGDFMTKKDDLITVKPSTSVDEALEKLVRYGIAGFPVIDDDWTLVGVVSGYDLLALNSISGCRITDKSIFPEVDSTWKKFNEIQKLSSKTNGRTVGEMMTSAPLVVREKSNLESAARLLLETKYRRLPVVDSAGKLIGIITRGNIVRAALQLKQAKARRT